MGNRRGLTLIELLVSLSILGIVTAMVFSFFIYQVRQNTKINNLNELHYQAQIVNNHLNRRISQCDYFGFDESNKMVVLLTYNQSTYRYDRYDIKLKPNGDLIENYNEMANYIDDMHFERDEISNSVHYSLLFGKGNETYLIENTVFMRNIQN
ncbi:MAG: type II secretion system protein [Eubacteriales bacterium]|nr:type II secretion system protein [Eubacteriales bacterium]